MLPTQNVRHVYFSRLEETLSTALGKNAMVMGSGLAGLAAASALSGFFDHVILLERDSLPSDGLPRPGTPQARHLHALLAGGQRALESLFPGMSASLKAAGAQSLSVSGDYRQERPGFGVFPQRDLGFRILSMTRTLLESEVRRRIADIRNIELREECRVMRLLASENHDSVTGIVCQSRDGSEEILPADLIVDATGHGELTLRFLTETGKALPQEDTVGIEMGYASAWFGDCGDPSDDWKLLMTFPEPPVNRRMGFLLPVEGGRFMVTLAGRHDCQPPGDGEGFFEYVRQLRTQTLFYAIQGREIQGQIARHKLRASRWRRFERCADFPDRLLPFGDVICKFNPIYGQGMSVAAREAIVLRDLLQEASAGGQDLEALRNNFFAQSLPIIDAAWSTAVVPDFIDPLTVGPQPAGLHEKLAFQGRLLKLAKEEPAVHKLMLEVQHMLKPRDELLSSNLVKHILQG